MRANKRLIFALGIVGFWTLLTYFIVIKNYDYNQVDKSKFHEKVVYLENEIKKETENRKEIISRYQNLIRILNSKSITTTSVNSENALLELESNQNKLNSKIVFNGLYLDNDLYKPVIPVLVIACNRVSISRSLDLLIKYRPNREQFPIVISQDCGDEATKEVILSYKDEVQLIQQPDLSDIEVMPKDKKFKGYYKISRHYGWALNTVFSNGFEFVIIVEDDLDVAPDFYEYFLGTFPLLRSDDSLWCVSAWNDNGKSGLIDENAPELLYRSDFFPGLGWMLSKKLWDEIGPKWPRAFWDDWIRKPEIRKDRVCIRPELPRSRTFGKIGVSNGLFFEKHLKYIKLSETFVPFSKKDLSYLLKDNYDKKYISEVYQTPVVTFEELRSGLVKADGPVRIQYNNRNQYKATCRNLGIMDDFKSGVPRTAYAGIVSSFFNNRRVYLAPSTNWKGYDPSWE
ncbi:alpha-1,3-mannosyl-glycoprotein 2-beta-N-acetylglucosaminyltransferase [Chironomus tepperi]|uniref:alpha-1,3-mannosyl-glycoprotein 2-beta-N-acetylglucosaminyltransferase n=1 Tax=Chironomus tepperi TaxID=113505 RepID=UPI00391FA13F